MILHIPHSGTDILGRNIEQDDINELTDWFTDELFFHKYSDRVVFPISRFVCDVERFHDDQELMVKEGHGICYTKGTHNNDIEVKNKHDIIENIYKKHHKKLNSIVRKMLSYFPRIIVVDCHSFTPKNSDEPDFCIGTNADTPDDLVQKVKDIFESKKYSVDINNPFKGALVPSDFVDDCRVFSIMIEVNKNTYMDGLEKSKNFKKIKKIINEVLDYISEYEYKYSKWGTMGAFRDYLEETFKDMGKLSPDELKKGQRLDKTNKDNFTEVPGRVFYEAISKIKENDIAKKDKAKGLDTLTVYSPNEYKKMKCYLGKNNSSGYALHGDELVSVFSTQGSSGSAIVQDAIRNGAKRLDCFATRTNGKISGQLYSLYSRNGFKINTSMNSGKPGEPYAIVRGISDYVDENEKVHPDDERVVIFMKH